MSNEPLESIDGPDAEAAEFRAEATGNPQPGQAATSDDLTGVDPASDPVIAPVRKRTRRVRSQPISGIREQRTRKRSQAVRADPALEQEPELLSGLEAGPASTEPSQAPDNAAESFADDSLNPPNGRDSPPHEAPAEDDAGAPRNGNDAANPPPTGETAVDSTPTDWNGSEMAGVNGSVPSDPAPAAAEFHDVRRAEEQLDHTAVRAEANHIEDRFVPRWQHHDIEREPEPQVVAAGAVAETNPQAETETTVRAPSPSPAAIERHSIKLQLALIALLPMLLGGLIPGVIAYLSPDVFAARSEIVLNISSLDWSAAERFRATQLVVVKARSTLAPISESMKIPLRDLEKDIQVGMVGSSDVISIQYANRDPATAVAVVNAVTAQYLIDLRDFEQIRNGRHRILLPATLLDDPVSLSPLRAAAIGVIVGLVIAMAGIVLRTQLRPIK